MRPPKQPKRPAAMRRQARESAPSPEPMERSVRRITPPRSAQTAAEPGEIDHLVDPRQTRQTRQPVRRVSPQAVPSSGIETAPTAPVPAPGAESEEQSVTRGWLARLKQVATGSRTTSDREDSSDTAASASSTRSSRAASTASPSSRAQSPRTQSSRVPRAHSSRAVADSPEDAGARSASRSRAAEATAGRDLEEAKRKASSEPLDLEAARRDVRVRRRSRRLRKIGIGIAIIAGLALIVYALFFSPLLAVKKDKIAIEATDPAQVLPAGQIDAITSNYVGEPVLAVDTEEVEAALEELTEVEDAHVHRSLPTGLTVQITARTPVACLAEGETCIPIDTSGVKLPAAENAGELPQITGDPTGISDLLEVMGVLPEGVRSRVTTAGISETGLIEFDLGGPVVKWGSATDNEKKAEILELLLSQEANVYDVSIPTAPVTS